MSILDLLADILGFFGPPRPDHDRSIVGQSPMEERTTRFWQRLGLVLLLAAGAAAFYVWILQPLQDTPTSPQRTPAAPASSR